ncbi:MAG: baseplate J/gp47 family protein [Bacillota bacterium]
MLLPEIDSRKPEDILNEVKRMVPFYTPEWVYDQDNPDMGAALLLLYVQMLYGNINKLNMVPLKNHAAFANLLNTKVMPSTPAQTFITFKLSEGAKEPVFVKKGTQVYAKDEVKDEQIIFETVNNLLVTPAVLSCIYNISKKHDKINAVLLKDALKAEGEGNIEVALFDFAAGENLQEHSLYLGYTDLLNIKSPTVIEIQIQNSAKHYKENIIAKILSDANYVEWMYFSKSAWKSFDIIGCENNRVKLFKPGAEPIDCSEINGETSRWIKCRYKLMDESTEQVSKELEFDGVDVSVKHCDNNGKDGMLPDRVLLNDVQMDPKGFYPFGDLFNMYNTFYFSSQEAFTKKNSAISIKFNLKFIENRMQGNESSEVNWKVIMKEQDFPKSNVTKVSVFSVAWEYWNGKSWIKLFNSKEYEEIFYSEEEGAREVLFECPSDMAETAVNNENNYWIRARVISIKNLFSMGMIYNSPYIENLTINYDFGGKCFHPEKCLVYNNAEFLNGLPYLESEGTALRPFCSHDTKYPGFCIGFDNPPVKGPISIYLSLKPRKTEDYQTPAIKWEYLSKTEYGAIWNDLRVSDRTNSLKESGTVVFAGPHDIGLCSMFGKEKYWIRALNTDGRYDVDPPLCHIPVIDGIHMNTVEAIQQESIEGEMLQRTGKAGKEEYVLARTPIISEEIWIDETGSLSQSALSDIQNNKSIETNIIRDSENNPIRSWIKWQCVEDFSESAYNDRHYVIDRTTGLVIFGDGKNGMMQPSSGMNTIKANYKVGGGKRGNLPSNMITELQYPIGFIERIYNVKASDGGCENETVAEALKRSTEIIKHRNRAVTADDFECLARQASRNIAKVKCLANFNEKAEKEAGCITIVIVPKDDRENLPAFSKLKNQVERYLSERASNTVSFMQKIKVIRSVFLEIHVSAVLEVNSIDDIFPIEKEAVERINKFLDPFEGNYDGKGWQIGQGIHESVFYPLLKSINAVRNVVRISLSVYKADGYTKDEIRASDIETIPHCLITNGSHNITVKTVIK